MEVEFKTKDGIIKRELTDEELVEWAAEGNLEAKIELIEKRLDVLEAE